MTIEEMYQQIGQEATSFADGMAGKLLLYAEVVKGVVSADLFYVVANGTVRYRFSPAPLKKLIYSFWEEWKKNPDNREWRTMSYIVDGGKFNIDFVYPDQIDEKEDVSARRPAVIRKYFGEMRVDYSKPK